MLCGIHAPTDIISFNHDPGIPAEQKLATIAHSIVTIEPVLFDGQEYPWEFDVTLPFGIGASVTTNLPGHEEHVLVDNFIIDDPDLRRHGIGSRLLRAALRYTCEQSEQASILHVTWGRLGLLNTVIRVLGEEAVCAKVNGVYFGVGNDKPLSAMFEHCPSLPDEPYLLSIIEARIPRAQALNWEKAAVATLK